MAFRLPFTAALASLALAGAALAPPALAQTPPSAAERSAYGGLHAAAAHGDADAIRRMAASEGQALGSEVDRQDGNGRTPLHVAAFARQPAAVAALLAAGADPGRLDRQRYDAVTIAAVQDDLPTLMALLAGGASARLVTSPYDGTALIAAAHLGHDGVVKVLIRAGAPLNHVNNLGWTALIEAVILGDGGPRHVETVRALVEAGADTRIPDKAGATPLDHARRRGYAAMVAILETAKR